jgi:hypothetical protein
MKRGITLHIDRDGFVPYYQQIVDQIRALVKTAALTEGEVFSIRKARSPLCWASARCRSGRPS